MMYAVAGSNFGLSETFCNSFDSVFHGIYVDFFAGLRRFNVYGTN